MRVTEKLKVKNRHANDAHYLIISIRIQNKGSFNMQVD